MKTFCYSVLLSLMCASALGCHSRFMRIKSEPKVTIYYEGGKDGRRDDRPIRDNRWVSRTEMDSSGPSCEFSLRKGVEKLTSGINAYFFPTHIARNPNPSSKLFDLTCMNDRSEDTGYSLPDQIEIMQPQSREVLAVTERTYASIGTFKAEVKQDVFWSDFLYRVMTDETGIVLEIISSSSLTVVNYVRDEFIVKLYGKISPLPQAVQAYNRIPNEYTTDPYEVYEFIQNYGTHVYADARFGGQAVLAARYFTEIGNKLHQNRHRTVATYRTIRVELDEMKYQFDKDCTLTTAISQGGIWNIDQPLSSWSASIVDDPSIIGGRLLPLSNFMDPNNINSTRADSFNEGMNNEKLHFEYVLMDMELRTLTLKHPSVDYIQGLVKTQMTLIRPDKTLLGLIKLALLDGPNFDSYYIRCRSSEHRDPNINTYVSYEGFYTIIIGFCNSLKDDAMECSVPEMKLPSTASGLTLFSERNCQGVSFNVYHTGELFSHFQGSKSYRIYTK